MCSSDLQGFNFSAINNYGRQFADGEYLLLLNNDVEVINGDWLTELLRQCEGNKERLVPISDKAIHELELWFSDRCYLFNVVH